MKVYATISCVTNFSGLPTKCNDWHGYVITIENYPLIQSNEHNKLDNMLPSFNRMVN